MSSSDGTRVALWDVLPSVVHLPAGPTASSSAASGLVSRAELEKSSSLEEEFSIEEARAGGGGSSGGNSLHLH